jgi:transmembrane sensor
MNMRLKETNPEEQFPVEQGWEELQERYEEKNKTTFFNWWKRYQLIAVAAVLLCSLTPALWWYFKKADPKVTQQIIAKTTDQIKLTLDNGETVAIDGIENKARFVKDLTFKGTTLIYEKETKGSVEGKKNTLEVPNGKQTKLILSDGTQVWVNAGSKLSYPTRFASSSRELTLEGEAFFDVTPSKNRPFIVHVKDLKINVLGTAFNINTFGPSIQTALERGKVNLQAGNKTITLLPGELGSYNKQQAVLSKIETNIRTYTAWKDEEIYFNNNSLAEIASRLEREYNLSFNFEAPELRNLHFTIDMPKNQGIQTILNNISLSTNQIKFVVKDKVVLVKKK